MVADPDMQCVYIGDRYGIKTLNDPDKPGLFIITSSGKSLHYPLDVTPAGLSLTSDKLLLVVCEHDKRGRSLRLFRSERTSSDDVGLVEVEERRIELQPERYLLQATEVTSDRYVVSQVHKSNGVHRILVVNSNGIEVSRSI